jgi:large subunit ribosomal protein L18
MKNTLLKTRRRARRKLAVRRRLKVRRNGAPRLSVFRSSKHISAQIIDDATGKTLAHATSTAKALASDLGGKTKTQRAAVIGAEIAKKAKDAGVQRVVFDRGFASFHGRIKALADAAREGGLIF